MTRVLVILLSFVAFGAASVKAQGGKAEPHRIRFAISGTSEKVSGTLKNGQEKDYVFGAVKGQTVTVKNSTYKVFDFRVFNEDFFDEGDFDSSPNYTFEIPETGDYLFTVRKKVAGARSSRFSMTIAIK